MVQQMGSSNTFQVANFSLMLLKCCITKFTLSDNWYIAAIYLIKDKTYKFLFLFKYVNLGQILKYGS